MGTIHHSSRANLTIARRLHRLDRAIVALSVFIVSYALLSGAPDDVQLVESVGNRYLLEGEEHKGVKLDRKENIKSSDSEETETDNEEDAGEFMEICGRKTLAPIQPANTCKIEGKSMIFIEGKGSFGRTGNNIREFFHLFQYAKDKSYVIGIMKDSWATRLVTQMWYAIEDMAEWKTEFEDAFCVKIIEDKKELDDWRIHRIITKDLFFYKTVEKLDVRIEDEKNLIRTLYSNYNEGKGIDMTKNPAGDMCAVIDAAFGEEKETVTYSVIHSRTLESMGKNLLRKTSVVTGCDPVAALHMEPDYIKSILGPIGMLDHPIILISDGENPEIFQRLHADPDIGPQIREAPEDSSWLGGDLTLATMANAFIGNPASSFSAFIAQSRVAFGLNNTYLFRAKDEDGNWVDVCDENCLFGERMA